MRKFWRSVGTLLSLTLVIVGASMIAGHYLAPDETERIVHTVKNEVIDKPVAKAKESQGILPTIQFAGSGGLYELDTAGYNEFILIEDYKSLPGLLPIHGAHNGLGGAAILNWEEGQHINIVGDGQDGEYVVTDVMDVEKFGTADQILPLEGTLGLQTCHYGLPTVRLVGLVPLEVFEEGWPPKEPQSKDEELISKDDEGMKVELVVED